MFKRLRVKSEPQKVGLDLGELSISQLIGDASLPVTIKALNSLPENPKLRLYRALIPVQILAEFDINPRTWKNPDRLQQVKLEAEQGSNKVKIHAWYGDDTQNEFFYLELADNQYNGIDLNFLIASNPTCEKYRTDYDEDGNETLFGSVRRNLPEEEKAMQAGLAPGQSRAGLRSSKIVFNHIETFLTMMAHHAFFLEPLTYVSAWIFEKRGFAYSKGHQLMDTIHREFQHGGELHKALHGSAPFRQPDQWKTVRGRAWAIHDGILQVIDKKWDDLKMIKQVGRHAGANTFPGGEYQELPMSPRYQITRAAELESLSMFRQFISDCCNRHQVPDETVFDLKLAVDEACTNVIEHGHKGMDPGSIILSFRIEPDRILVSITDFGHIFEPGEAPRPDVEAALDDRPLGGLGLYLIYQTMDNIDYQSSEEGNTLTFTKYIKREINS